MIKTYRILSVFTLVLVFAFTGLNAQQITGTISGVVSDETGGVLPGVEVTARNTETGATRTVVSDDEGRYRISQLAPGSYELRAELAGFQTALLQDIGLSMAQGVVVGVTLRVGEITEQVVVSAEVSLVETTSASVSALVEGEQVRDLPLNGRDFIQLAALQEGVVTPPSQRRSVNGDLGVKISIGGARTYDNAMLLDGTDIKNQYGTTPGSVSGSLLGVDTVREFQVITSAYSAEYGRFTGGVISAVTRSGTNELHGTVFAFHRNSALDARNFFDRDPQNPLERSKVPGFKRNQFGFTLGGPIAQDRTFFFGSYEGLRERLNTTEVSAFPNEAAHNGFLPNVRFRGRFICGPPFGVGGQPVPPVCDIGVAPNVQPYMDLYPIPNGDDVGDSGTALHFWNNPRPIDEDYFLVKFDHKLTDSDDFFIRMTIDDGNFSEVNESSIWTRKEENLNQYWTLEEKHVFSPTLLNEFRFAFNRSSSRTDEIGPVDESLWFVDADRQRAAGFEGGMGLLFCRGCGINQFGTSTRTPQQHVLNTFQYMDNLVWTRGRHSLKIGVSASRFQYNFRNFARLQGTYQYDDLRRFMQGTFTAATVFFGDLASEVPQPLGFRQSLIGIYIQDDVQVQPNLTVNLGVRYEFITNPTEVAGRLGNLDDPLDTDTRRGNPFFLENPSLKNFSPRVGFAWDPTGSGKFSVRGGFGLFHQQILQWCCSSALFRSWPFGIRGELDDDTHAAELANFPNSLRNLTADHPSNDRVAMFAVSQPSQPYLMQWSLTLQRELFSNMAVTAKYSGSRGVKLPRVGAANVPAVSQDANGGFFFPNVNAPQPNQAWTAITDRRWDGNSYYNALSLGLRRRFSGGNMFQLSYTWQKSIDNGSVIGGSPRETFNDAWLSQYLPERSLDRGLSAFSIEQAFSANWGVELPFGKGRRYGAGATGIVGKLIEGWQINGIVSLQTGPPSTIDGNPFATCRQCNNTLASIRPGIPFPKSEDPNGWWVADIETISDEEFPFIQPGDTDANGNLIGPALGYFGNLARNAGEGPGVATLDFSVLKNFYAGERTQVQFRAEFFNILNRTNFQINFRERNTHSRGFSINRSFGRLNQTSTSSRQIQFALKISF
jgi:hypothetical protein